MEKIVIVTSPSGPDYGLLATVNMLFSDCEINVVYNGVEAFQQLPASRQRGLRLTQQGGCNGEDPGCG